MNCNFCTAAADTLSDMEARRVRVAVQRVRNVRRWHAKCREKTAKQQEILPFALSSCCCQHRVEDRVAKLEAELQDAK